VLGVAVVALLMMASFGSSATRRDLRRLSHWHSSAEVRQG